MEKIYDCFTFFNELDVLELRLEILYPYVDHFVISEMSQNFFGKRKPLNFKKHEKRFLKYMDKIIYVPSSGPKLSRFYKSDFFKKLNKIKIFSVIVNRFYLGPWKLQVFQRNNISKGLMSCSNEDIIMVSDVDEILNPKAIPEIKKCLNKGIERVTLLQKNHIYYLNGRCMDSPDHNNMKATKYNIFKTKFKNKTQNLRIKRGFFLSQNNTNTHLIKNGGWHFTYMGGADRVAEKMNSICAGLLYGKPDVKEYEKCIDQGILVGNNRRVKYLKDLSYLPKEITGNMKKWKSLIKDCD